MSTKWTDEEINKLEEAIKDHSNEEISSNILPERTKGSVTHKICRLGLERPADYTARRKLRKAPNVSFDDEEFNNFISGFVAGEGCFTCRNASSRDGKRFAFQISLSDVDKEIIVKIKEYFKVGNIYELDSRKNLGNQQFYIKYNQSVVLEG